MRGGSVGNSNEPAPDANHTGDDQGEEKGFGIR